MQQIEFLLNGKFGSFIPEAKKKKRIEEEDIPEPKTFLLNGKFGSFIPEPKKKERIEGKDIPESKSVQHCFGQPEQFKRALDEIIQRLIAVELKKHRDKEQISINRTYSDSETILHKNNKRRQPINLDSFKLNLDREERNKSYIQMKRSEKTTNAELRNNVGENTTFRDKTVEEELEENDEADKAKEVEILQAETETAENVDSILHEQKLDSHNAEISVGDVKDLSFTNNETRDEKQIRDQKDDSTQTEHYYLIRTSQSCPVQKKQLTSYLYLHLNQSTTFNKIQSNPSMEDFPCINLSLLRKASDNLIYEKHKGSGSPSYNSSPERFRWRYISPKI